MFFDFAIIDFAPLTWIDLIDVIAVIDLIGFVTPHHQHMLYLVYDYVRFSREWPILLLLYYEYKSKLGLESYYRSLRRSPRTVRSLSPLSILLSTSATQ